MARLTKSGKYRDSGLLGKVKFDLLPPRGSPEVKITGPAALFAGGIIAGGAVAGGGGAIAGGLLGGALVLAANA
ncbi:hypothetical protein [Salarchaeum sp. III]|uniref:hypothetical protein n=1 Tax=Salarchaeum sp. III TaxID=3107927 RepID=UPI002ED79486